MQQYQLNSAVNFRDLGGLKVADGAIIKPGLLFRAGTFSYLKPEDQNYLSQQLKLQLVLDYRDQHEITQQPDKLWPGADYIHAAANPADSDLTADMQAALQSKHRALSDPEHFMLDLYRRLPFANPGYQQLVTLLCDPQPRPLVQHCMVGKDRTGVGVALTLFALGADEETVMQDYLLSEQGLQLFRDKILPQLFSELDAQAQASVQVIFAAKAQFLQAALQAIKARYQSIDNWLAQDYGLTESKRQFLRQKYLC